MSPTSYQTAPPRESIITTSPAAVKPALAAEIHSTSYSLCLGVSDEHCLTARETSTFLLEDPLLALPLHQIRPVLASRGDLVGA